MIREVSVWLLKYRVFLPCVFRAGLISAAISLSISASSLFAANVTTSLKDNVIDLGSINEGVKTTETFSIINNTSSPINASVEVLGCACLKVISPKEKVEIPPYASQEATFELDTTGLIGEESKFLYIYTSDAVDSLLRVEVKTHVAAQKQTFIDRFSDFSALAILSAGLIDGINPCAFTVMVFFVSFLAFTGYRRRDLIVVGILFILSVYITYMLIGLGFFKTIRSLESFVRFSHIFYRSIAVFAFVVGTLNIYDFWVYVKTKNPENVIIKLPFLIKRKIQSVIRQDFIKDKDSNRALVPVALASLSCGFLVSILELFCTGQLYLPAIAFIMKLPDLRARAMFYFLLYNFMFILPLICVFILAFYGFTSSFFERIARKHLAKVKLLTAVIFLGLGVLLLIFRG
ncbi:MAG: hypothetical protein COV72_06400 [Candidatus Omnitrophica bacterium CG11_big_fil_rev_8_21_14_0_20_42_13]|uniref:Cytochrome C biogenesis protein transmembrane domain-containing protein n=1 Tax=Candidatus Ghiorseimicrobium undicola TaxID=1974746 RepID=A0A2H0LWV4_9BACT|nr:MAG: hypothetical protein COV72_06400 [Candidatus Omnitrophica bacterium CG11_big_fil_rev_8_21_14_0_20_42_13]